MPEAPVPSIGAGGPAVSAPPPPEIPVSGANSTPSNGNKKARTRTFNRRPRKPISCHPCRQSKLKCDRQQPCASCKRRERIESCVYEGPRKDKADAGRLASPEAVRRPGSRDSQGLASPESLSSAPDPNRFHRTPIQTTTNPLTHDHDYQEYSHAHWDALLQRPIDQMRQQSSPQHDPFSLPGNLCFPFSLGPKVSKSEILAMLPSFHACEYLITQYFLRLSPLFHILHGPTFQKQYDSFKQNPSDADLSWMALLFLICSATLKSMENDEIALVDIQPTVSDSHDISSISYKLRAAALICLSQDQFLIRHNINTLEALLVLIYTISNIEAVEHAWTLLGIALNIGIALQCNTDTNHAQLSCIDIERHRRCWAGILMLHTYQAISFRDVNMSLLLNTEATMPADVNDVDIRDDAILPPSSKPTQMSVMKFKFRMFQLSSKICHRLSGNSRLDEATLDHFDSLIFEQQQSWDTVFLLDGSPSILDTSSYAHWCILQLYAHQLYLLIHRPFCKPHGLCFRPTSRVKCISSGAALLDIHRQFCDLPRLRHYRWFVYGLVSFYAIHGAMALASCLLDEHGAHESSYYSMFAAAVARFYSLQSKSQICIKACPILRHLQSLLSTEQFRLPNSVDYNFGATFDDWIDGVQWLNPESINWEFWDSILNNAPPS